MRIQRMLLKLQPYTFQLRYIKGKSIGLADCLSRLSLNRGPNPDETMDEELMVCKIDTLAYSKHEKIARATQEDSELQTVKGLIIKGWPENPSAYGARRSRGQFWQPGPFMAGADFGLQGAAIDSMMER